MSWQSLTIDLILTLIPILTCIVGFVLVKLARFIIEQTGNLEAKVALEGLEKIIFSTVSSLSQSIVDDLKATKADGKLTEDEAKLVKDKAKSSIGKQLNPHQKEILEKHWGSLDEFIDNFIEQKVLEIKLLKGDIH